VGSTLSSVAIKWLLPQRLRQNPVRWWCSEVEDTVIHHRLAQEPLKTDRDDDFNAKAGLTN